MGYVVGYSTSSISNTRRRGNVVLGVDSDGYDKTSVSGLYAGVAPVPGKHNIVRTFQGADPDFYSLSNSELLNFVNGLGSRNLTTLTPSQDGWQGNYSIVDSDTRTFNITTQQNNAATTSAWRTWYWDVSDYEGQAVSISATVEFVSETDCSWRDIHIGQGNTGSFPRHIAGSDPADKVKLDVKPITPVKMEWSGTINSAGLVGFTQWINNVTVNGANAVVEISNVQIEVNNHVTEFSNPDKIVTSVTEARDYLSRRNDTFFFDDIPNDIETDGLILELDASNSSNFIDNEPTENLITQMIGTTTISYPEVVYRSTVLESNVIDATAPGGQYSRFIGQSFGNESNNQLYSRFNTANIDVRNKTITYSVYLKGSGTCHLTIYADNAGYSTTSTITLTDEWTRYSYTTTPTNYTTNCWVAVRGVLPSTDVYISAQQAEPKTHATPFVDGSRPQNTTWRDLSGNNNSGSIENGITFTQNKFTLDNVDDRIAVRNIDYNALANSGDFTIIIVGKKTEYGSSGNSTGNSTLFQGAGSGFNTGWRIIESNTGTPGDPFSSSHSITVMLPQTVSNRTVSDTVYRPFFYAFSFTDGDTGLAFLNENISQGSNSYGDGGTSFGYISYTSYGVGAWGGDIQSLKVYDRGLSLPEIRQNYYGGPIVTDGLVLAVDAGNLVSYESGSTTAYSMTGSYSGSLLNGVSYTDSQGGGFNFDGSNDYIETNVSSNNWANEEFTIEGWFKYNNISGDDSWFELCRVSDWGLTSVPRSNTFYFYWVNSSNTAGRAISSTQLQTGNVIHMAITFTGVGGTNQSTLYNNTKIYLNGVEIPHSSAGSAGVPTGGKMNIGASGYTMNGDIYTYHYYNRVLSADEVLQNYNAQKSRFI